MEQVCQYKFDKSNGERETVTVKYDADDGTVIREYSDYSETYSAVNYKSLLEERNYDDLFKYNQVLLDFLNARLGD